MLAQKDVLVLRGGRFGHEGFAVKCNNDGVYISPNTRHPLHAGFMEGNEMRNVYIVQHRDDFDGLYVAAETRGQAKAYMAYDEGWPFVEYYAKIVKKNVPEHMYGYLSVDECEQLGLECYDEEGNIIRRGGVE